MKKIITLFLLIGTIQLSASFWQRVNGPTNGKSATSIFSFNNEIYASCQDGVYLTDDEGIWNKNEQAIFDSTGIVRVFYQKNNVALISGLTGKLFVTYDNGATWNKIENIKNAMFGYESVLIIDETVYAQEHFLSSSLYKLEKNSKNWEKVYIDIDKKDSIYAGKLVSDGDYIFAGDMDVNGFHKTGGGITISSDKGKTWHKLDNFKHPVTNMVIHNEKLYVAAADNYIYRTSDKGISWVVDTNLIMPTDHFLSFGGNLFAAVNNTASNFKADYGLLMSSDDGVSWVKRSDGLDNINYIGIKVKDSKLYVLTKSNTIFESTDNGEVWSQTKLIEKNINSKNLLFDNDTLYASAGFGIYFSTDNGVSWENKSKKLSSAFNRIRNLYKKNNILVVDEQYGMSLYISTDGGEKWEFANISGEQGWVGQVYILEDKIVVTSNKKSTETSYTTDYGVTWQVYDDPVFKKEYIVGKLVREDERNISVFTSGGILKSSNNGIEWENIGETNPTEMGPLIVKDGVYYGLNSEYYIYKSKDKGFNWESTAYKISKLNSFIFDLVEDNLIIPIENGLKISSNFGKTFEEYLIDTTEIISKPFAFNDVIENDGYLIATSNEGIWRAKLSDLGIVKSSVESEIERNYLYTLPPYPNPAKSEVKVLFYWDINLPMTTDDISIYDITGKKIDAIGNISLVKQESHYGNIIWDCSSAQPGIYLINIKHGTEEKAVKVVVE